MLFCRCDIFDSINLIIIIRLLPFHYLIDSFYSFTSLLSLLLQLYLCYVLKHTILFACCLLWIVILICIVIFLTELLFYIFIFWNRYNVDICIVVFMHHHSIILRKMMIFDSELVVLAIITQFCIICSMHTIALRVWKWIFYSIHNITFVSFGLYILSCAQTVNLMFAITTIIHLLVCVSCYSR